MRSRCQYTIHSKVQGNCLSAKQLVLLPKPLRHKIMRGILCRILRFLCPNCLGRGISRLTYGGTRAPSIAEVLAGYQEAPLVNSTDHLRLKRTKLHYALYKDSPKRSKSALELHLRLPFVLYVAHPFTHLREHSSRLSYGICYCPWAATKSCNKAVPYVRNAILLTPGGTRPYPNMSSKKIYWGDGKAAVRDKLGLEDDINFVEFEVAIYIPLLSIVG